MSFNFTCFRVFLLNKCTHFFRDKHLDIVHANIMPSLFTQICVPGHCRTLTNGRFSYWLPWGHTTHTVDGWAWENQMKRKDEETRASHRNKHRQWCRPKYKEWWFANSASTIQANTKILMTDHTSVVGTGFTQSEPINITVSICTRGVHHVHYWYKIWTHN